MDTSIKPPIEMPISAIRGALDMSGQGRRYDAGGRDRSIFLDNQIRAHIAMLDTEGDGTAIIAETGNGYLVRISLTPAASLDLARVLLAKVKI